MPERTTAEKPSLIDPASVTRLLVVSFFIALSLGLIEGADIKLLATPFLPEESALLSMRALMLILCVLILTGFWRKPAALILAMMVFWPSYIALYAGGDVSAFWRDLALIGGLIMASSETNKANKPRETENAPEANNHVVLITETPPSAVEDADDHAYRKDFNLARSV